MHATPGFVGHPRAGILEIKFLVNSVKRLCFDCSLYNACCSDFPIRVISSYALDIY